jgi:hypothetical protein
MEELEALTAIDEILSKVPDADSKARILRFAWDKHAPNSKKIATSLPKQPPKKAPHKPQRKKATKTKPTLLGNLNLTPEGKKAFKDFASNKNPTNLREKCLLAVYYLKNEIGLQQVSVDHIYTCFKDVKWKLPADLHNTLSETSSRHAWLDTSDYSGIKLTLRGENYVEHELPKDGGN